VGEYDDLLEEVRSKAAAYTSTAKIYIPKMYNALINESKNISPEDARDRIEKDCIGIWSPRTILNALPDEAKNLERQKSGRLGQKKRKFAAVSAAKSSAPESPAAEITLDTHGRSTDRESTIDESSKHRSKEQLKTKEPATEQDQARLAAEQEPLKEEVLVDRSGQGTVKHTRSPQENLAKTQGSGNTHVTGKDSIFPVPRDKSPCENCPAKDIKIKKLEERNQELEIRCHKAESSNNKMVIQLISQGRYINELLNQDQNTVASNNSEKKILFIDQLKVELPIPREKYPNLEEAVQKSKDSVYVVFDKSGKFERAIPDTP